MPLKITPKMLDVLGIFLASPGEPRYGLEIAEGLEMASGTLYPLLGRLERAGLLHSELEGADPRIVGRGERRFYRLTGVGEVQARVAAEEQVTRLQRALGSSGRARPVLRPREALP
jgi:PadR family transcriptional regulator PadR